MNLTPSESSSSSNEKPKTVRRKAAVSKTGAKGKSRKKTAMSLDAEEVALRAYFIAEHRQKLGIPGDATSDWVQAEQELLLEIAGK